MWTIINTVEPHSVRLACSLTGCLRTLFIERALAGLGAARNEEASFSDDKRDPLTPNGQRQLPIPKSVGIRGTGIFVVSAYIRHSLIKITFLFPCFIKSHSI